MIPAAMDVFLSYSREDQVSARRFAEALQREGLTVWWDQSLNAGDAFDRVTERALDEASAVVVLWSRRSVESRWVRAEATQAQAANRLVPVMIEACRRPIMFELTHTADLSQWDGDEADPDWRSFIDGLRKFVLINAAATEPGATPAIAAAVRRRPRRRISWAAAAAIAAIAAITGGIAAWPIAGRDTAQSQQGPIRVSLPFNSTSGSWPMGARHIAISPDGSHIAFAALNTLQIRSLRGTAPVSFEVEGVDPFFSPDGAWIGVFATPNLVKVPTAGGKPTLVARVTERPAGASWSSNGFIVFATTEGLFRVAEGGGERELIAAPRPERRESRYAWPELLPGDTALLYTVISEDPDIPPQLAWLDLRSRASRQILSGGSAARYSPTGHLVYAVGQQLYAIRFDAHSGETRGKPVALNEPVVAAAADNGAADFALAGNGTLISRPPAVAGESTLVWVDRDGTRTQLPLESGRYEYPRVAPDGKRIAIDVRSAGNRDIWIWDSQRTSLTRLTNGPAEDMLPEWSVDGRRVFFASNRDGSIDVYSQAADGSSEAQLEVKAPGTQMPLSFTPDGKSLIVYENFHDVSVFDIGQRTLRPLLHDKFAVWLSALSPDGHWIAYESQESGPQTEIFLRPFPDVSARREQISINGGRYPVWSRSGTDELYYLSPKGEMMSAVVRLHPGLRLGAVSKLFDWQPPAPRLSGQIYDVSPVTGRFLMVQPVVSNTSRDTQVALVLNWFDQLRNIAP